MLVIEPVTLVAGYEKLTSIRVGPTVGHRQKTRLVVLSVEAFVIKLRPVDGNTTRTILLQRYTHKRVEYGGMVKRY